MTEWFGRIRFVFVAELPTNQALNFMCGGHESGSKLSEEVWGVPRGPGGELRQPSVGRRLHPSVQTPVLPQTEQDGYKIEAGFETHA